jgi:branched-chain amino acid transport system permease protein
MTAFLHPSCSTAWPSGMLLFVLAVGLSVTLGLMNVVNLAHGAFGMVGGYVCVVLLNSAGVPFLVALSGAAAVAAAALGWVLERTALCPHLPQRPPGAGAVLHRPGLHAGCRRGLVDGRAAAAHPASRLALRAGGGRGGRRSGATGIFLIAALRRGRWRRCISGFTRTRFGARLRAAVDDGVVARGMGLPVPRIFTLTFALGSGLAGLGGALGVEVLGLDPTFPLKYMVYFLIVVAVGGTNTVISGPSWRRCCSASWTSLGKYLVPQVGAFIIYTAMVCCCCCARRGC